MTRDGLDEGLINRLREKYANMSAAARAAEADDDKGTIPACRPSRPETCGNEFGQAGNMAGICGICTGSGERKYEYNFRQMTEQCKHCDGDGIISRQPKAAIADDAAKSGTFNPTAKRVMTQLQM
eukprot:jgi/Ulvmu1/756/UM010_0130.1